MSLPSLPPIPGRTLVEPPSELLDQEPILLRDMDYTSAKAVPGAIYSREHKCMILPAPTVRAATVALVLQPTLANNHPELVDLRDSGLQDVKLRDYATELQIKIQAPVVHAKLRERGHDWLEFDHEANQPVGPLTESHPDTNHWAGDFAWPRQDTDLGYIAAILQRDGFAGLGWSRGYGKTLGTAAIIEANKYRSVLVAAPNGVKYDTWLGELEYFLPSHEILVLGNTPKARAAALERAQWLDRHLKPFVLVVHHEVLAMVAGKRPRPSGKGVTIQDGWRKLGIIWDLFVVDESHRLKNYGNGRDGSQLHRAACKVPCAARLACTGSFFENDWEEPFGQLHWLAPDRYASKWEDWNLRFLDFVKGHGMTCVGLLPGKAEALGDELGVFFVIREKTPKVKHETLTVKLSEAQQKAYDDLVDYYVAQLPDGTFVSSEAGVVQLGRLRQVATGLDLFSHEVVDSTKVERTMARVAEFPDRDFFLATWYKGTAYTLETRLRAAGYRHVWVITGDTPNRQRDQYLREARGVATQPHSEPVIVIGTIATTGEGLNLQFLNHAIRVDRCLNPAKNQQVADRIDRTGQTREVYLDDVVAEGTVDDLVVMPNLSNKDAFKAMLFGRRA